MSHQLIYDLINRLENDNFLVGRDNDDDSLLAALKHEVADIPPPDYNRTYAE